MASDQLPEDPNKIDISLSLLSGQSGIAFNSFVEELKGLQKTLAAMAAMSPDAAAAATRSAADFYLTGMSEKPSRATAEDVPDWATRAGTVIQQPDAQAAMDQLPANPSRPPDDPSPPSPLMQALGKVLPERLHDSAHGAHQFIMNKTGGRLGGLATGYYEAVGTYSASKALLQNIASHIPENPADIGYEQGYSGGTDVPIFGPLGGARLPYDPFSSAGRHGLQVQFSQWKDRFAAGYNKEQARTTYGGLNERGWLNDDPNFHPMKDTLKKLTQWNPVLGQSQTVMDMLDKSVRYGGVTDLSKFRDVIQQIPKAAKAAHVSLEQMSNDMLQMGEFNRSQGGTFFAGTQAAQDFALTTGLPPALLPEIQQNPYVQANVYNNTGLAPWQQGLATPADRTIGMVDSIQQLAGAMGRPKALPGKVDKYGFRSGGASGLDQQVANIKLLHPELAPETIKNILKNGDQMKAQAKLREDSVVITNAMKHDAHVIDDAKKQKEYRDSPEWVKRVLEKNGNIPGVYPAGSDQGAMADYAGLAAGKGKGRWGALEHEMKDAGFSKKEISEVGKAGAYDAASLVHHGGVDLEKIAKARQDKINEIIKDHSSKFGGQTNDNQPKVTIELGKAARKVFHLTGSPQAGAKSSAGAGGPSALNSWAGGPSYMDTFGSDVR